MLASAHRFRRSTILALGLIAVLPRATQVHAQSSRTLPAGKVTAEYALAHYSDAVVRTLADLVAFPTVHEEGRSNQDLASFNAMTAYLKQSAERLGLDFTDAGAVIVIGMGRGDHRLGLLTHGDVQPADATKWAKSPFSLDSRSRAGRLIGRGTEDDKGPIAAALFAMKAVKDQGLPLTRRIELIIS